MLLEHVVNLDNVYWWLQFLAIAIAVATPLIITIRKYSKALKLMIETNAEQSELIQESIADRQQLHQQLDLSNAGIVALLEIELDKGCAKAICRGTITSIERTRLMREYKAYEELGGNDGIGDLIDQVRALPVIPDAKGG
jgi:hypothetical protein